MDHTITCTEIAPPISVLFIVPCSYDIVNTLNSKGAKGTFFMSAYILFNAQLPLLTGGLDGNNCRQMILYGFAAY